MGFTDWEYEPERFRVDDWVPDFWLVGSHYKLAHEKHLVFSAIIEYKPAAVTASYKELLAKRFSDILARCIPGTIIPILACGSPFNPEIPREIWAFDEDGWDLTLNSWLFKRIDEAKTYRFDLSS